MAAAAANFSNRALGDKMASNWSGKINERPTDYANIPSHASKKDAFYATMYAYSTNTIGYFQKLEHIRLRRTAVVDREFGALKLLLYQHEMGGTAFFIAVNSIIDRARMSCNGLLGNYQGCIIMNAV